MRAFQSFLSLVISAGLTSAACAADARDDTRVLPGVSPWVSLAADGTFQDRLPDRAGGSVSLFSPLLSTDNGVAFLQADGDLDRADVRRGRMVLGYRSLIPGLGVAGLWAGYAAHRDDAVSHLGSVVAGVELLTPYVDVRASGQLAGDVTSSGRYDGALSMVNGELVVEGLGDRALSGVDAEIGLRLPVERWVGLADSAYNVPELRLFGGGFYYDSDGAAQALEGGRLRAELRVNDLAGWRGSRLTLDGSFETSDLLGDVYQVGARLRLPLGATATASSIQRVATRLNDRIPDTDFRFSPTRGEPVIDHRTDVRLDRLVTVASGDDLQAAISSNGANTLFAVNGTFTSGVTLVDDQTLVGGGGRLIIRGANSGTLGSWIAPGPVGSITAPSGALVTAADRSHLVGFTLDGMATGFTTGNFGVDVGSGHFVVIEQGTMRNLGDNAVNGADGNRLFVETQTFNNLYRDVLQLTDGNTVSFTDNIAQTVARHGLFLGADNSISIERSAFDGVGGKGILLTDNNQLSIDQSDFSAITGDAIDVASGNTMSVTGTGFTDVRASGIEMNSDNTLSLTGVSMSDITTAGIRGLDDNTITIASTALNDVGLDGVATGNDSVVSITGTSLARIGRDGVRLGRDGTISFVGGSISDAGEDGIAVDVGGNVTVDNVSFAQLGQDGISVRDASTVSARNVSFAGLENAFRGSSSISFSLSNFLAINLNNDLLNADSNNTVEIRGGTLDGADDNGIQLLDDNQLVLDNVQIANITNNGIRTGDRNQITVTNSVIDRTGVHGIRIGDGATLDLATVVIQNAGVHGVTAFDNNVVSGQSVDIRNSGGSGINLETSNRARFAGLVIDGAGNDGIDAFDGNDVSIERSVITNAADDGIVSQQNGTLTLRGSTIASVGEDGIFADTNNTISVIDSTIEGTGNVGLNGGSQSAISVEGTRVLNTTQDSIRVADNNTLSITSSQVLAAGDDSVQVGDNNTVTIDRVRLLDQRDAAITTSGGSNNVLNVNSLTIHGGVSGILLYNNDTLNFRGVAVSDVSDGIRSFGPSTIRGTVFNAGNISSDVVQLASGSFLSISDGTISNSVDIFDLDRNTVATITDFSLVGSLASILDVDGTGNTILFSNNLVSGTASEEFISLEGGGPNTLNGTGNGLLNGGSVNGVCEGAGAFTGTIEVAGFTIVNGGAPCF